MVAHQQLLRLSAVHRSTGRLHVKVRAGLLHLEAHLQQRVGVGQHGKLVGVAVGVHVAKFECARRQLQPAGDGGAPDRQLDLMRNAKELHQAHKVVRAHRLVRVGREARKAARAAGCLGAEGDRDCRLGVGRDRPGRGADGERVVLALPRPRLLPRSLQEARVCVLRVGCAVTLGLVQLRFDLARRAVIEKIAGLHGAIVEQQQRALRRLAVEARPEAHVRHDDAGVVDEVKRVLDARRGQQELARLRGGCGALCLAL
mmetsp:Transcript_44637/g.133419  ORF Transcript_44637/g.133419 Transcript_44637/m.133419 type:complete len:258 (+) Transcript_44637:1106-1879(+)